MEEKEEEKRKRNKKKKKKAVTTNKFPSFSFTQSDGQIIRLPLH